MSTSPEHPLALRVQSLGVRLHRLATHRDRSILRWAAIVFVIVFSLIGAWKLWSFNYNALDLAIYRQVATNSIHGQWFQFTIHPHSYLGDHLELFLVALLPLFALFQHPLTLIVLQALALAIAAFPLTKCAERFVGKPWHLLFGLAYLANPVVQNMALFEFHLLPFAIPLISFALLAWLERKFWRFLLFALLALTIREDVSLVIAGFGVLALVERRDWRWSIIPLMLGSVWFVGAMKLTAVLSGYGHYKFLVYYKWLGASLPEILKAGLLQPWRVIAHLFAPANLAFLVALFLPFAYLPLWRLRWLIPTIPIFIQILLVQSPGELLLSIHYPSLLLPFLLVASAAGFTILLHPPERGLFRALKGNLPMMRIIVVVVVLYSMVVIGPLAQAIPVMANSRHIVERVELERNVIQSLPAGGTVAGFETLTELANRSKLYSLHYVFLGKKQFSDEAYVLPADAEVILFDLRDALFYQLLYKIKDGDNRNGYRRIRTLLEDRNFTPTTYVDRFVVFQRRRVQGIDPLYSLGLPPRLNGTSSAHDALVFLGWTTPSDELKTARQTVNGIPYATLPLNLTLAKTGETDEPLQLEFRLLEGKKLRLRALMPLAGGVFPTSDWTVNQPVTSRYELLMPKNLNGKTLTLEVRVLRLDGKVALNGVRSLVLSYREYTALGSPIVIGQFTPTTR